MTPEYPDEVLAELKRLKDKYEKELQFKAVQPKKK